MKARSTAPGAAPPAHPALAEAAEWTALLRSGAASPEDLAAFETWRSSSREHEAAAATLARMLAPLDRLREQGIGKTLREEALLRARRRQSRRSFVLSVGAGVGVGLVGWNAARDMGLTADRHTGLAQRSQAPLPDGSTLWMDARTSADIAFDTGHRTVVLRQGRVLAEAQAGGAPFTVRGPQSTLQTQGGKFVIQTNGQQMLMVALQGNAAVAPAHGSALSLEAGQRVTLGEGAPAQVQRARGTEALWTQGLVALDNEPLRDLIAALQPYRAGVLQVEPEVADLRVSGLFSLDDTDRTLQALQATLPVRVNARTRYWVTVARA